MQKSVNILNKLYQFLCRLVRLEKKVKEIEENCCDNTSTTVKIVSPDGSIKVVDLDPLWEIEVDSGLQALINSALQAGDNISLLFNDAGYITSSEAINAVCSAIEIGGCEEITVSHDDCRWHICLSNKTKNKINSALQPGDNISELKNNVGYITLADVPSSKPLVSPDSSVTINETSTQWLLSVTHPAQKIVTSPDSSVQVVTTSTEYQLKVVHPAAKPLVSPDGSVTINEFSDKWELTVPTFNCNNITFETGNGIQIAKTGACKWRIGIDIQTWNKINSALQPSDNISLLNNDAGYITCHDLNFISCELGKDFGFNPFEIIQQDCTFTFCLSNAFQSYLNKINNKAQKSLKTGDNISELENDKGYVTINQIDKIVRNGWVTGTYDLKKITHIPFPEEEFVIFSADESYLVVSLNTPTKVFPFSITATSGNPNVFLTKTVDLTSQPVDYSFIIPLLKPANLFNNRTNSIQFFIGNVPISNFKILELHLKYKVVK